MAITATNGPDLPGVEFSLTMFEDPGCQLPESITSWVAMRALPDFITNMRLACLKLRAVGDKEHNDIPRPVELRRQAAVVDIRAAKDVCPLEEPLLSPRSPTHNPERIKDDIKDQDRPVSLKVAPSELRTASEETSLKEEDS